MSPAWTVPRPSWGTGCASRSGSPPGPVANMQKGDVWWQQALEILPHDCRNMLRTSVLATVPSGFHQFNADAVRRGDVTQPVPAVALLEVHGKLHAFGT